MQEAKMHQFKITDEPFARGFCSVDSEDLYKKTGNGLLFAARERELNLYEELGLPNARMLLHAVTHFGSGIWSDTEYFTQMAEEHPELADDYNYIIECMDKYNLDKALFSKWTEKETKMFEERCAQGGGHTGHAVPSWSNIAKYGTDGYRKYIEKYRQINKGKDDFYDGLILALDSLDVLGERYHALALERAKSADAKSAKKLLRLAKSFEYCPRLPAKDFCDACAVYALIVTMDWIDSPGHFDWYMWEFWEKTDRSEALEMLDDIWQFWHILRAWNTCIGGSDENGNDKTNDLTYAILEIATKYAYNTPNLTLRVHKGTPEKLLRAAADCLATGCGLPGLYNDEVVCPALERLGIPPQDSHLYVMNGCNQIDIQGKSHMGLEDGEVNLGKAVEFALSGGINTNTGDRLGLDTGSPTDFATFDDFFDAVKRQVIYLADEACRMANKSQKILAECFASPLRAIAIEGCIEKGRGYKDRGPIYGHGQILAEGIADAADSCAIVKKYVYEEKRFTMAQLCDALAANFEGYDEIYETVKNTDLHFGNDIPYVDLIAKELVDCFNSHLLTVPTWRGGFYGGGCSPFDAVAENGIHTGALPNGKKRGESLYADSIGATPGCDVNGPTAVLKSCLNFDQTLPTSGFILNIKFEKTLFDSEKGKDAFISLVKSYFGGGGQMLAVAVVAKNDLEDAKIHPEAHKNLIVRVGGYSDHFINLNPELQDNIIARVSNAI